MTWNLMAGGWLNQACQEGKTSKLVEHDLTVIIIVPQGSDPVGGGTRYQTIQSITERARVFPVLSGNHYGLGSLGHEL